MFTVFSLLPLTKDRKSGRTAPASGSRRSKPGTHCSLWNCPVYFVFFVKMQVLLGIPENCTRVGMTFFIPSSSFWAAFVKVSYPHGCHFLLVFRRTMETPPSMLLLACNIRVAQLDAVRLLIRKGGKTQSLGLGEAASAFGSWWPCGRNRWGPRRGKDMLSGLVLKRKSGGSAGTLQVGSVAQMASVSICVSAVVIVALWINCCVSKGGK